jgi:hypothetical protein
MSLTGFALQMPGSKSVVGRTSVATPVSNGTQSIQNHAGRERLVSSSQLGMSDVGWGHLYLLKHAVGLGVEDLILLTSRDRRWPDRVV